MHRALCSGARAWRKRLLSILHVRGAPELTFVLVGLEPGGMRLDPEWPTGPQPPPPPLGQCLARGGLGDAASEMGEGHSSCWRGTHLCRAGCQTYRSGALCSG